LESPWQQRISKLENQLLADLLICISLPQVTDVRVLGAVGIVELKNQIDIGQVQQKFVKLGVWIRPFRNLIYIMPPYIITPAELSKVTDAIIKVIATL